MVFGWGKKKKVEYEEPAEPVNSSPQNIKLDEIPKILNDIVPKYGTPQINLEGSGEPTMAKDLPSYIQAVKEKNLKCLNLLKDVFC